MKKILGIKEIIIIIVLLVIWTIVIIMVGKGVKKLKNTFFPEKTAVADERVVALEEEIAELKNLIMQKQNGNAVVLQTSEETSQEVPEEQATDTATAEAQTEVQQEIQITDSEYVTVLPYGTEIYQLGYDVYDIIYLSDYLSESNGYLTRRPYDAEDKEVWCPEDSAVLRERNTGKCKLIVFQGFGTRPE